MIGSAMPFVDSSPRVNPSYKQLTFQWITLAGGQGHWAGQNHCRGCSGAVRGIALCVSGEMINGSCPGGQYWIIRGNQDLFLPGWFVWWFFIVFPFLFFTLICSPSPSGLTSCYRWSNETHSGRCCTCTCAARKPPTWWATWGMPWRI